MSLISSKNFLIPLTNKVHLITIFIVALAFAAFRMAGCNVHIERPGNLRGNSTAPLFSNTSRTTQKTYSKKNYSNKKRANTNSYKQKPDSSGSPLEDLEKSLGL